jgi:hypothetical protein
MYGQENSIGVVITVLFVVLTRREEFGGGKTSVRQKTTINHIDTTIEIVSSTHSCTANAAWR